MIVQSHTSDYKNAIIEPCKANFPDANYIGCLFHLRQAWRRYLTSKLHFEKDKIKFATTKGVLNLLTNIPYSKVKLSGILFV